MYFNIYRERERDNKENNRNFFIISPGSGQMCDTTLTVSSFSENQIEDDVRTCIECVIRGTVSNNSHMADWNNSRRFSHHSY